jgi:hypothetical protein
MSLLGGGLLGLGGGGGGSGLFDTPFPIDVADLPVAPFAFWNLNGVLTDSSGNGKTLTNGIATTNDTELLPGCIGLFAVPLGTPTHITRNDTAFSFLGAVPLSLVALIDPRTVINTLNAVWNVIEYSNNVSGGVVATDNTHWNLYYRLRNATANAVNFDLGYRHENGARVNNIKIVNGGLLASRPLLLGMTRSADGVTVQLYVNGKPWGTSSVLASVSTDGASATHRLRLTGFMSPTGVGVDPTNWQTAIGFHGVWDAVLSAADHLAIYNLSLGRIYGQRA